MRVLGGRSQKSHLIEVSFSTHVCLGTGIDGLIAEIEEEAIASSERVIAVPAIYCL